MRCAFSLLALLALVSAGCRVDTTSQVPAEEVVGSGRLAFEERDVRGFSRVEYNASGNVTIFQGEREGVQIDADDNVLPLIVTRVRGDTLRVSFEKDGRPVSVETTRPIEVGIYLRDVRAVTINGAATVTAHSITTSALEITSAGVALARFHAVTTQALTARISGSGTIEVEGTSERVTVNISGMGTVQCAELKAREADVTISGSGRVEVAAERELNVRISGNGSVEYVGEPRVSERIDGIGTVRQKED
jgi:hypothetical protein